jgi:hypothetical protein
MSAGNFETGVYLADDIAAHYIRAQEESKGLTVEGTANGYPAIGVNSKFWVKASQAKRAYGLKPRKLRIRWTGTPPAGYLASQPLEVVVYDPALWATTSRRDAGTYLGQPIVVVGKIKESVFPE